MDTPAGRKRKTPPALPLPLEIDDFGEAPSRDDAVPMLIDGGDTKRENAVCGSSCGEPRRNAVFRSDSQCWECPRCGRYVGTPVIQPMAIRANVVDAHGDSVDMMDVIDMSDEDDIGKKADDDDEEEEEGGALSSPRTNVFRNMSADPRWQLPSAVITRCEHIWSSLPAGTVPVSASSMSARAAQAVVMDFCCREAGCSRPETAIQSHFGVTAAAWKHARDQLSKHVDLCSYSGAKAAVGLIDHFLRCRCGGGISRMRPETVQLQRTAHAWVERVLNKLPGGSDPSPPARRDALVAGASLLSAALELKMNAISSERDAARINRDVICRDMSVTTKALQTVMEACHAATKTQPIKRPGRFTKHVSPSARLPVNTTTTMAFPSSEPCPMQTDEEDTCSVADWFNT
jgi:hypothetical protein